MKWCCECHCDDSDDKLCCLVVAALVWLSCLGLVHGLALGRELPSMRRSWSKICGIETSARYDGEPGSLCRNNYEAASDIISFDSTCKDFIECQ